MTPPMAESSVNVGDLVITNYQPHEKLGRVGIVVKEDLDKGSYDIWWLANSGIVNWYFVEVEHLVNTSIWVHLSQEYLTSGR